MTRAKDPNAVSAVPDPSRPETRRVRVIPGLRSNVHTSDPTDSIFIPLSDCMPAALFGIASAELTITDETPPSSSGA